jgi:hypothetical protein
MSNAQRIGILVATVVALVVAFIALNPSDDESDTTANTVPATVAPARTSTAPAATTETRPRPKPAPKVPTIVVRGAKPVGGVRRIEAHKGDRVTFDVRSPDTADEIHLHGYDIAKDLQAGGRVRFSFTADAEGIFEVELEGRGVQIGEIRVQP